MPVLHQEGGRKHGHLPVQQTTFVILNRPCEGSIKIRMSNGFKAQIGFYISTHHLHQHDISVGIICVHEATTVCEIV